MAQEKVLVISLGELRETIYTLPLLSVLKKHDYTVEFLTSEKGFEIVNRNPLVNRVHLAPMEQWMNKMPYLGIFEDISEVSKKLQKREFDIAIDCQQSLRSFLLFAQCGANRRLTYSTATGFASMAGNELIDTKGGFRNLNVHQVEKNLNFARYLGLDSNLAEFMLPESKYSSKIKMDKFITFQEEKPILVLSPNMQKGEASWHPKNWVNLVANIPEKYNIIVIGTQQDNTLANKLTHKNLVNLCGKTNFEDLRYIISLANTLISNSIETSVIAWAMNKEKVITISTNESPQKYNPYNINNEKSYKTLIGNLPCQPCNRNNCEQSTFKCSHLPTVENVLNSIR